MKNIKLLIIVAWVAASIFIGILIGNRIPLGSNEGIVEDHGLRAGSTAIGILLEQREPFTQLWGVSRDNPLIVSKQGHLDDGSPKVEHRVWFEDTLLCWSTPWVARACVAGIDTGATSDGRLTITRRPATELADGVMSDGRLTIVTATGGTATAITDAEATGGTTRAEETRTIGGQELMDDIKNQGWSQHLD